jgi:vacuolar-type H+-ATPase subunit E/Vma4
MKEAVDEPSEKDNDLLLKKNEEYLAKIESLKIEFDEKLEAEKQNFYSAQSALLKAMDTIASNLEEQISNFVLNTASELAGYEIDKMPTAFAEKIKKTVKQISSNKEEVTIHLNPEDFGMIESLDVETDFKIKFVINKFLSRGAFEISTNKSTARVVPLNPPVED